MCWGSGSVSSVINLGNLALAIQSSRVPGITHLFHEASVYPASLAAQKVESACNTGDLGSRPGFNPWIGKIPWKRKWQPTPVFLPGKSHGWRSLAGYSAWGPKESDMTEWLTLSVLCLAIQALSIYSHIRNELVTTTWVLSEFKESWEFCAKMCWRKDLSTQKCLIPILSVPSWYFLNISFHKFSGCLYC